MKAIYIPSGPANIEAMYLSINFRDVEYYFLELLDSGGNVIATTVRFIPEFCDSDHVQIHFVNSCGAIDSIGMKLKGKESARSSERMQKPMTNPFNRSVHGIQRLNIRSTETQTATTTHFAEKDMEWLDELFNTPMAWIQWTSDQGEGEGYLPIVITDTKLEKLKENERFTSLRYFISCVLRSAGLPASLRRGRIL